MTSDYRSDRVKHLLANLKSAGSTATTQEYQPVIARRRTANAPKPRLNSSTQRGETESWNSARVAAFEDVVNREAEVEAELELANERVQQLVVDSKRWQDAHSQAEQASTNAMSEVMQLRSQLAEAEHIQIQLRAELKAETEMVEELSLIAASTMSVAPGLVQQATVQLAHTGAAMASQAGSVETLERELRSKMVEYSSKLDHMLALEARLVEAQELLMAQESEINRLTNELRISHADLEAAEHKIESLELELAEDVSKDLLKQTRQLQHEMESRMKQLERDLAVAVSPYDMTKLLERTKEPLVSQIRLLTNQLSDTRCDSIALERSRDQMIALNVNLNARLADLEKELSVALSPSQLELHIAKIKAPLVSKIRLLTENTDATIGELKLALAAESMNSNELRRIKTENEAQIKKMEAQLADSMSLKEVAKLQEKTKAPLVNQLRLIQEVMKEKLALLDEEKTNQRDGAVSRIQAQMNKRVAALENELSIMISPAEMTKLQEKSKAPLVAQLRLIQEVSAKRIAEIDAAKTLQMDNAVASLDRKAKSEISSLKQEMGKMFTRDQMNSFTSRSKAPLMSQLRLMKEVSNEKIKDIEEVKNKQLAGTVFRMQKVASEKISQLEQQMASMFTYEQMTDFTQKSKAPLVSQLRLMQQVTAERIAEIELSKYDTIDRKVSAVEDLANKKIAGLEKTMSSMYTHQQMTKFVAKSKAPLVSQLRLMQEVTTQRIKEIEATKNEAMDRKVNAVIKEMNKQVSALEKEMSAAVSLEELDQLQKKVKQPLVSQMRLLSERNNAKIVELENQQAAMVDTQVANAVHELNVQIKNLERQVAMSVSQSDVAKLQEKTKAPLVSQLRLLQDVTVARIAEIETVKNVQMKSRLAATEKALGAQIAVLSEKLSKSVSQDEFSKLQQKSKAPLVSQMRLLQETTSLRLKALEDENTAAMNRRVSQVQAEFAAKLQKLEQQLSKSVSMDEVMALQEKAKAPLVIRIRETKEQMMAQMALLELQLDDSVPRSKLANMQQSMNTQMKALETQMAQRIDVNELAILQEKAKTPLMQHMRMLRDEMQAKVLALEGELAASVPQQELLDLQASMKAKMDLLQDELVVSTKELDDLERKASRPALERLAALFSE